MHMFVLYTQSQEDGDKKHIRIIHFKIEGDDPDITPWIQGSERGWRLQRLSECQREEGYLCAARCTDSMLFNPIMQQDKRSTSITCSVSPICMLPSSRQICTMICSQ